MKNMKIYGKRLIALVAVVLASGCSANISNSNVTNSVVSSGEKSSDTKRPPPTKITETSEQPIVHSLTIVPASLSIQSQQRGVHFTAYLDGIQTDSVDWATDATDAVITPLGVFKAPPRSSHITVKATLKTDYSIDATASVTVRACSINGDFYSAPGSDGVWATEDDALTGILRIDAAGYLAARSENLLAGPWPMIKMDHTVAGLFVGEQTYSGPGTDGVWFDSDDQLISYGMSNFSIDGSIESIDYYSGRGADGIWGNSDDSFESRSMFFMYGDEITIATGCISKIEQLTCTSAFRLSLTDVPLMSANTSLGVNLSTKSVWRNIVFSSAGVDGVWGTFDDEVSWYELYEYTPFGEPERFSGYTGPGTDAIWFTDDDWEQSWIEPANAGSNTSVSYYRNGDSVLIGQINRPDPINPNIRWSYDDPGPDLVWETYDDHVASRMVSSSTCLP